MHIILILLDNNIVSLTKIKKDMSTSFFTDLGIKSSFVSTLERLGITKPTAVQEQVIPVILETKKDVVALAQTGTGKTLAFGLPLLQKVNPELKDAQVLILAPTRELGQQILDNLISYKAEESNTSIIGLFGGVPLKEQLVQLKSNTQIIVATPGRLLDLVERDAVNLSSITNVVLDEADNLIRNFKQDLALILKACPKKRRTLLFTATLIGAVRELVNDYMSKNVITFEADLETKGHQDIEHQFVVVEPIEKLDVLMHFLNSRDGQRGIIFCKTKAAVNKLAKKLAINKFSSGALHGSLSQGIRDRIMGQFREAHIQLLVATDLAARGLDVKDLDFVVNYHLPDTYDTYVHRTGRTARAGATGYALTVLQQEEAFEIPEFEEELDITFKEYVKADANSIAENNGILWAKKIFKTKPNRDVPEDFKAKIKTIFHHLTKEELVDKILAHYLAETAEKQAKKEQPETKKKK